MKPVAETGTRRARHVQAPRRGDERRAALLHALERLLAERPLARIGVADISAAAGVTRSGFYFYFATKGAAVAALLEEFRDQMLRAGSAWYDDDDTEPLERVAATVAASAHLWREHAHLLVAMLDAAEVDAEAREIWSSWTQTFIHRISLRIAADARAGTVQTRAEPEALAILLMGATAAAMESDVRATAAGRPVDGALATALVELWHRTLYAPPL